jgi:hypothetical protein
MGVLVRIKRLKKILQRKKMPNRTLLGPLGPGIMPLW